MSSRRQPNSSASNSLLNRNSSRDWDAVGEAMVKAYIEITSDEDDQVLKIAAPSEA